MHRGTNLPLPVLANTAYATSSKLADVEVSPDEYGNLPVSHSYIDNSVEGFAHACSMVKKYQQSDISSSIVDYSFQILTRGARWEFPKWSIVYDLNNKTVYFKSARYRDIKSLSFSDIDLSAS